MCVTCARRRGRTHYYARVRGNPDALAKAHAVQRRWKYGLVDSKYQSMVAQAKGRCSVCLNDFNTTNRKMVIDHDHESGIVRGLLCSKCNVALGMLGDSKETVVRLLSHLS